MQTTYIRFCQQYQEPVWGLHALPWTDTAREWCLRVQSLRHWQPEADWPDVSEENLLATLEDWLGPHLDGVSRRSHLDKLG